MLDLLILYKDMLIHGIVMTVSISAQAFLLGFLISSLLTFLRFFESSYINVFVKLYIDVFRGTPLLVQLLLIYFGLPSIGIKLDAYTSAVLAIGLNSGAYQAEIIRVAVKGIPEEQILVAKSMGLSNIQIYTHVLLPQAIRSTIPGLVNEYVTLLKESSLASVIGVMELTRVGEYMTAATFRAMEAYLLVALIYLLLSYLIYFAMRRIEKVYVIPGFERWIR